MTIKILNYDELMKRNAFCFSPKEYPEKITVLAIRTSCRKRQYLVDFADKLWWWDENLLEVTDDKIPATWVRVNYGKLHKYKNKNYKFSIPVSFYCGPIEYLSNQDFFFDICEFPQEAYRYYLELEAKESRYLATNKLLEMERMGFRVTWNIIYIGLYATENYLIKLTFDELSNYIHHRLSAVDYQSDSLVLILCALDDHKDIKETLLELLRSENTDYNMDIRKLRAVALKCILDHLSTDTKQGLTELRDFCIEADAFQDCTAIYAELKNELYTAQSYEKLIRLTSEWLDAEVSDILRSDAK